MAEKAYTGRQLETFDRKFWDRNFCFSQIGTGSIGGKASGLVFIRDAIKEGNLAGKFPNVTIDVPTMAVIATDFFDLFLQHNRLRELKFEDLSDHRIGMAFQQAELPAELVGDLRALASEVKAPMAIRSSSLMEDALERPFAGVYATKMIPNNQPEADIRFRKLAEAVKFVYASTFFREAREYIRTTGCDPAAEKMAVILQEVVGLRHGNRFYQNISGVARSVNFYPVPPARPEDGVVNLALGLGKTIVDGGRCWVYSPALPKSPPPFGSVDEMIEGTQREYWAVNMGRPTAYDPVNEVEYMQQSDIEEAEYEGTLDLLASTLDPARGRIVPGTSSAGARVLNFAPQLVLDQFPLNALVLAILRAAEDATQAAVEIEFALTFQQTRGEALQARFGFLQVRPLAVSQEVVDVPVELLRSTRAIVASDHALGNGIFEGIYDVVYVRPEAFSSEHTPQIADEIGRFNEELREENRQYVLIGFGRWGSSHASLGIPVDWSRISGACAIVEATLPGMNVEMSQGSHFFHNLSSFHASYLMVRFDGDYAINWAWLNAQECRRETSFVRHVRSSCGLSVRVDGRTGRAVLLAEGERQPDEAR